MTLEGLEQMVAQNDDKQDEAHKRLRGDLQELRATVESNYVYLRDHHEVTRGRLDTLVATPVDVTKLVLAPRVVVGIVAAAVTLAAGLWGSTYGLRSDVRDILTRMDAQQKATEAVAKLQDLQWSTLKTTIDDMKRRQELQQFEIQALTKEIVSKK